MATNTHRASPQSKLFFGIAASASQVRNEKSRNRFANRSGAHPIEARPPQTSLIDAEWDLEPFVPAIEDADAANASAPSLAPQVEAPVSVRPPHTSLIDAEWEELQDAPNQAQAPTISVRAPRTTAIDESWEPITTRTSDEFRAPAISVRAPRTTAIDEDWEPITTRASAESQAKAISDSVAHTFEEDCEPEFVGDRRVEEQAVGAPVPMQAPLGRSVAAVTLAALLALTVFGGLQGYKFVNRHREIPHAGSMLRLAPLPIAGISLGQHWDASWLESASAMASNAGAALAAAEAELAAKSAPKKPVVNRRAYKPATSPSQAVAADANAPAANTDGVPATNAEPPTTAADNGQPPASATTTTSHSSE